MFKPPFQSPPYDAKELDSFATQVQAPPIGRVDIILGAGWDRTLGGDPIKASQDIIRFYSGRLEQFFRGQEHNFNLGVSNFLGSEMIVPGLTARFSSNQGTNMLYLEVHPQNTGQHGSEIQTGGVFVIDAPFTEWSIIGPPYFTSAGGYVQSPPLWGAYLWDSPQLANTGGTGLLSTPLDGKVYWEVEVLALPSGVPATISTTPGTDDGSTTKWDVFSADPDQIQFLFPSDLNTFLTPVLGLVPETFLDDKPKKNIVLPKKIIGTEDASKPGARTIGVVPSKNRYSEYTTTTWVNGRYVMKNGVYSTDFRDANGPVPWNNSWAKTGKSVPETAKDGISTLVSGLTTYQCLNPKSRKEKDKTVHLPVGGNMWVVGIQGSACLVTGARSSPWSYMLADENSFPLPYLISECLGTHDVFGNPGIKPWSEGLPHYPPGATAIDGGYGEYNEWPFDAVTTSSIGSGQTIWAYQWGFSGTTLGSTRVYAVWGTIDFIPGVETTSSIANYAVIGDVFWGDDFKTADYSTVCAAGGSHYTAPVGVNKLGPHAWVFKGRADQLKSTKKPGAGDATPVASSDTMKGLWTGVDLESIQVGDVFMFAVDTKSRKVWIGKNKKWFDITGQSEHDPSRPQLAPVTYMDGDKDTKYYPACSYRLGHTKLRMRFGTMTKHLPPSGFTAYDLVTIELP